MRPAPGLVVSLRETISRGTSTATKGGASKFIKPGLKFQRAFHAPHPAHPRAHSSNTSWRSAANSFLESIYAGVFRSVRSAAQPRPGPYGRPTLPARTPFIPSAIRQAHSRALPRRAHFGPSPRPVAQRSTGHNVGLGAARSFSSSGFGVLDNVVHNAPLALRALSGQFDGGLDDRKWKKVRRELRAKNRTDVKGKGVALDPLVARKEKRDEFALYFGGAPIAEEERATPVTLTLAVDPDVELPLASTSSAEVDVSFERLITPSLLTSFDAITTAYKSHSHRLRVIVNRLSAAGLLDPEVGGTSGLAVDSLTGRRVWQVTFHDGFVTRQRVESVVRGDDWLGATSAEGDGQAEYTPHEKVRRWNRQTASSASAMVAAGEGGWWCLAGGSPPVSPTYSSSAVDSSVLDASFASASSLVDNAAMSATSAAIDAAYALAVAEAFVLPNPASSFSDLSPPSSLSFSHEELEAPAALDAWEDWTAPASLPSASIASFDLSASEHVEEADPAVDLWAAQADDLDDLAASVSLTSEEYETGVRTFLGEVEEERERRKGWARG
ncbi:hypothetical protein JCM10207_000611 [Rhodosporidiobolus poonsookiae]